MEFFPALGKTIAPKHRTLILPALSIGNIGQLAVDLLVSSLQLEKVGYLDDPNVLPCVGNDPFGPEAQGKLTIALEVYESLKNELLIVQQRSLVIKGGMLQFARNIADWAYKQGVKEVIIISGLDSRNRIRYDRASPQIHYVSTANIDGREELCESIGWERLEKFSTVKDASRILLSQSLEGTAETDAEHINGEFYSQIPVNDETHLLSLPFAALLSCCKAKGLKVLCLCCFCAEGDNIPDAFFMAESARKLLNVTRKQSNDFADSAWIVPLSWRSVYGPPAERTIYT